MESSKLLLSADEFRLVKNTEPILTKNRIIKKVVEMFAAIAESYKYEMEKMKNILPEKIFLINPKISKGENYNGLPYVMLDYPRLFTQNEILAIRTFFWWGNYFSLTLHLKGESKEQFLPALQKLPVNLKESYFISTGADEWSHDLNDMNYKSWNELKIDLITSSYLKIAARFTFDEWENIPDLLKDGFKNYLEMLKIQLLPRR